MRKWMLAGLVALAAGCSASEMAGRAEVARLKTSGDCRAAWRTGKDDLVRRAAFTRMIQDPGTFDEAAKNGLADRDPVIRRRAVFEYAAKYGEKAVPELRRLGDEKDPAVQYELAQALSRIKGPASAALLRQVTANAADMRIRRMAAAGNKFNFYRKTMRLRENPAHDYEIVTVKSIQLPTDGWRFNLDPENAGHLKKFFAPAFDDSLWTKLKIGTWEAQGFPGYDGIAWYRVTFTMPQKIDSNAVELFFQAVDESAWVWLNGVYVGQHDIGPDGWNVPFYIDVTREIKWGAVNKLVVRVEDTAAAGGIWKPVSVEVLK